MIVIFVGKRLAFGSKATRRRHVERLHAVGITQLGRKGAVVDAGFVFTSKGGGF
jgi:hypothetical protein